MESQYTTLKGRRRRVMNHFVIRHIENGLCGMVLCQVPAQTCTRKIK